MTHRIGIIGGDGIGPEVIAEGLKVSEEMKAEAIAAAHDRIALMSA